MFLKAFHPDATDHFNTCSDLERVVKDMKDPNKRHSKQVCASGSPSCGGKLALLVDMVQRQWRQKEAGCLVRTKGYRGRDQREGERSARKRQGRIGRPQHLGG